MAENKKNTIVMTCSIVACVVTLLTCGILIGGAKSDIGHLSDALVKLAGDQEETGKKVSSIETDQAFQKGVVQTQLTTQGLAIVRIEKKLDDLVKVD
jgi:hypothetical protein